jgi:hypothetical protein
MNADGHRFHHPDVGIGAGGDSEGTERTEGGRQKAEDDEDSPQSEPQMNADGHRFHHPDVGTPIRNREQVGAGGDSEDTEQGGKRKVG